MEEGGFTVVQGKKRGPRRPVQREALQGSEAQKRLPIEHVQVKQETISRVQTKLDEARSSLVQSRATMLIVDAMACHFASFVHFRRRTGGSTTERVVGAVCYGLGSVSSAMISMQQLAFIFLVEDKVVEYLMSKEHEKKWEFKWTMYDPAFAAEDVVFLRGLEGRDVSVLEESDNCRYSCAGPTMVFMPHCGAALYTNLIEANILGSSLDDVYLVGNGVADMYSGETKDIVGEDADTLLEVVRENYKGTSLIGDEVATTTEEDLRKWHEEQRNAAERTTKRKKKKAGKWGSVIEERKKLEKQESSTRFKGITTLNEAIPYTILAMSHTRSTQLEIYPLKMETLTSAPFKNRFTKLAAADVDEVDGLTSEFDGLEIKNEPKDTQIKMQLDETCEHLLSAVLNNTSIHTWLTPRLIPNT